MVDAETIFMGVTHMKAIKAGALAIAILAIGAQVGKLFGGPGSGYGDIPFAVAAVLAWFAARYVFKSAK